MPNHAYRAASAPSVVQRARNTRTGRKLERGGYLTVETVTMWIVYALTLIGNAVIEGGRVGGTTSADIAYGVFTWFTPAGYVFAIWSLIYVAMVVWLVAYTRTAPVRADRFTMTSILFIASCALNVLWLALWHFELVAVSFHRHPGRVAGAGGAVPERAPHDEDRLGTGARVHYQYVCALHPANTSRPAHIW